MKCDMKRITLSFVIFILAGGMFGGIISIVNQYLRKNDLATPFSKTILIAILIFSLYHLWRWLCRRLDASIKD